MPENAKMQLHNIFLFGIILLVTTKVDVYGINLASTDESAQYMVSPVVAKFGINSSLQLPTSVNSSFYGYDFKIIVNSGGNISMLIGSPKMIDPASINLQISGSTNKTEQIEPKGSIHVCQLDETIFQGISPKCTVSNPRQPKAGDNFGISIPTTVSANITSCSITRMQDDCGNLTYTPGFCFKSNNFGLTWEKDRRTKMLECPIRNVELLFVLDGSGSVGEENFPIVKNWVKTITEKLNIDKGVVTVGVVQYSYYDENKDIQDQPQIKTYIKIGEYTNYQSFAAAMKPIRLFNSLTYTGKALEKVVYDFENTELFKENTTKQVMVLLTDGKADDSDSISANAKTLRDMGVTIYAIGVGNYKRSELRLLANGNTSDDTRVFTAENFDGLEAIAEELENEIGSIALEGSSVGQTTAGYKMEFGAVGIVATYSISKPEIRSLNNDTRTSSVWEMCRFGETSTKITQRRK
ncbi:integrin alpha-M-like isoform X2 [Styela clava]